MLFEEAVENRIVLQKAQSELKRYLSIDEQYWKQKAGMSWFEEGDRNTRFFHNHVNGKRQKLQLKIIQNHDVSSDQNLELCRIPTIEEVKAAELPLSVKVQVVEMVSQSGFVKGRSIFENILLTQEIIIDIRLRGKPANVVIKLDMAKAYDRVSWKYLMHVLRKMGFVECFINMIWNLLSNNWYSVLINGQASGYFHSTRGVK
nr:uncharacterized protein LOC104099791 [Nicotiana tomentosiformis]